MAVENFGASATFPSSSAYLRLMHWWIFPSLYTTHVMAHLSALWGKTKQFHQVTSRKYYFWNNSSHVIALQNQPLCKRILCFRKEFHHLKVYRHGRHHPCLTSVGQALKGSTVQACRRNLIVNDFKTVSKLWLYCSYILLSYLHNDTRKPPYIDGFCSCMCITWELAAHSKWGMYDTPVVE